MNILYLDHAATTPCREEVWEAMRQYAILDYGNPDSLHSLGRRARRAVEDARETIAECLNCAVEEIVFTSGGSESNNLALRGLALANRTGGKHIITTNAEHPAVLDTCRALEDDGFDITYLAVDEYGQVTPEQVLQAIRPETLLVSIMHANNEIGTIQPIAEIAGLVKHHWPDVLVHTDAVQTVGHLDIDVEELGVDLLSFTPQKFYGPKGIGGLYVREGVRLKPQIAGARRKRGLESGTLSVPLIVGMAVALKLACKDLQDEREHWVPVRDKVIESLLSIENCRLNGHPVNRLPTNISISFLGVRGEDVVLCLDKLGICASTGSACTTGIVEPSHVLTSLGLSRSWALGAVRLSLGHACRDLNPDTLVRHIRNIVEELRSTNFMPRRSLNPKNSNSATDNLRMLG